MKILLDTNMLILPGKKIDIYELLKGNELVTTKSCIRELENLAKSRKNDAASAKIALEMLNVDIMDNDNYADDDLVLLAKKHKIVVATNDRKLIKTLSNYSIKYIRLRQNRFIESESI